MGAAVRFIKMCVMDRVQGLLPRTPGQCRYERRYHGPTVIEQTFRWVNHLDYRGHTLAWLEGVEVITPGNGDNPSQHRFVHLTNLAVNATTVVELSCTGRLRWKIGVSGEGHITQSVPVRPRPKDSSLVAWEAPWRESKTVKPSDPVHRGCTATHQVVTCSERRSSLVTRYSGGRDGR
jgi:hypothetical protein